MDSETTIRFVLVLAGVAAVLILVFGAGIGISRWARRSGRRPWLWVTGAYVAASIVWAIVRSRVVLPLVALALLGCGSAIVLLVHPKTGALVECRDNLFDGISDTLGRCVDAYKEAGFEVKSRK